jgi:IS5 family transposase
LSYQGHALVENRNGLIAAAMVKHANGYAERDAALVMLQQKQQNRSRRITVGTDKAYDMKDFVRTARELNVTPHVTRNDKGRKSNLDRRTTRQPGYAVSLSRRWLVERGFGWLKQTGPLRQVKLRWIEKVDWLFVFSCAAHNLLRLPKLMAQPPASLRPQCA